MASPRVDIRRAPKEQGRWWIITVNDREAYRETTAKAARRIARNAHKFPGFGVWPLYNPKYVGTQPADSTNALQLAEIPSHFAHLFEPEPLETQ